MAAINFFLLLTLGFLSSTIPVESSQITSVEEPVIQDVPVNSSKMLSLLNIGKSAFESRDFKSGYLPAYTPMWGTQKTKGDEVVLTLAYLANITRCQNTTDTLNQTECTAWLIDGEYECLIEDLKSPLGSKTTISCEKPQKETGTVADMDDVEMSEKRSRLKQWMWDTYVTKKNFPRFRAAGIGCEILFQRTRRFEVVYSLQCGYDISSGDPEDIAYWKSEDHTCVVKEHVIGPLGLIKKELSCYKNDSKKQ